MDINFNKNILTIKLPKYFKKTFEFYLFDLCNSTIDLQKTNNQTYQIILSTHFKKINIYIKTWSHVILIQIFI